MWQGALAGLAIGAALGAVSSGDIKKPNLETEYGKKVECIFPVRRQLTRTKHEQQQSLPPPSNKSGLAPRPNLRCCEATAG
jgi:hypothetical protein